MKTLKKNGLKSAREACFLALRAWLKQQKYLADSFQEMRQKKSLDTVDLQLAQEIAFGVVRRFHTLDAILKKTLIDQKIKLKQEAKLVLKMAVYQLIFMDKVPIYAVVFESVELCKKYCPFQSGFINGILRKLTPLLPIKNIDELLSIEDYYSLPLEFVKKIKQDYPQDWKYFLETTISRPKMTYLNLDPKKQEGEVAYQTERLTYQVLKKDPSSLKIFQSKKAYIQNPTPGILIDNLSSGMDPKTILDLCSAPGGKLILTHYLFPQAQLYANEISSERMKRLEENLQKYDLHPTLFCQDGKNFQYDQKFDLIIIDAPCSNSGVLNKKPEAKFRLEEKNLQELKETQKQLITQAVLQLSQHGIIFYLTCSVLKEENEEIIHQILHENPKLKLLKMKTLLPDLNGLDGGFGAAIQLQ